MNDGTNQAAVEALPTVRQDFQVPVANVADLQHKLARLNKRAEKLGLKLITLQVLGEEFIKTFKRENESPRHIAFVNIRVEGETPRVNGWDFIATLQHLGDEGNIIRSVPGFDVAESVAVPALYRTAVPACDHCQTRRNRNDTFVLRNVESGEFKQVGRNCLADFLRTTRPEDIAAAAEFLHEMMDAAGAAAEESDFGSAPSLVAFQTFMTHVVTVVRVEGAFISKSKARVAEDMGDFANAHSTVGTVETLMNARGDEAAKMRRQYASTDEDAARAAEVIAWARENVPAMLEQEQTSDYLYNLSVVVKRDFLDRRMLGIAGSVIAVFNRDLAKKALAKMNRETLGGSKHFGAIGERIKFLGVTLLHTHRYEGNYGPGYVTKMLTDSGDVAVWFGSSPLSKLKPRALTEQDLSAYASGFKVGDVVYGPDSELVEYGWRVVINGTVKRHDERDGIKQTILGRCTVWTEAGIAEEQAKQARKAAREAKKAAKATKAEAA
jgi:hypothetical protein